MFYFFSKLFNLLICPASWIVLLLVISYITKTKKRRKILLIFASGLFLIFTNNLLLNTVRYQTTKTYSTNFNDPDKHYEVAIVLGGFASMNKETGQMNPYKDRSERIWEAVRLYQKGLVKQILITGDGAIQIRKDGSSTADLFLDYMENFGIPKTVFILEQHSLNTRENALFSTRILREMNIPAKQCILITSATHMERSLSAFEKEDYQTDYLPVNIYIKPEEITWNDLYPRWDTAAEWSELFNEWIGRIAYRIAGYN